MPIPLHPKPKLLKGTADFTTEKWHGAGNGSERETVEGKERENGRFEIGEWVLRCEFIQQQPQRITRLVATQ